MSTKTAPGLRMVWLARAVELCISIVLAIILSFGIDLLHTKRAAVSQAQLELEREPQVLTQQEIARQELKKHEHDIARLQALFVSREAIDAFLTNMETEAAKYQVTVLIPDIQEQVKLGKDKKPEPQRGPYRDIVVKITVSGEPNNVLEYLHALEHASSIIRAAHWELRTDRTAQGLRRPASGSPVPKPDDPQPVQALLEGQLILTVFQADEPSS